MFKMFRSEDDKFFRLFEESADILHEGALLLKDMMSRHEAMEERLDELVAVEQKGDKVTEQIIDKLNQTFITPFDREDIYSLARELDEILDSICSTVEKMVIYETGIPIQKFREMVDIFVDATDKVKQSVYYLKNTKNNTVQIMDLCYEIKKLETAGDKIYRLGVADLFKKADDAILVIKWKEVFEQLETALDRCEKVAKLIRGVVVKYA
ncbi:Putitive phosphate transport regulator [Thermincola potens JR]|uniref:Putitive phosphate transport regulator n=2 Tax=Thermincola TaxID=278993 RepID=D5X8M2_THEPJ|nr:Putitive phosphate transport regulator [Thermincola potens JR]